MFMGVLLKDLKLTMNRNQLTAASLILSMMLTTGCNPLSTADSAVEYATGQEYTADDYKTIGKQIAEDTTLNLVPGGDMVQFAAAMPEVTRTYLMETFRARRDAAINQAVQSYGIEADVFDAEDAYYDNYISCLAGSQSSCAKIAEKRNLVRTKRAALASLEEASSGGHSD